MDHSLQVVEDEGRPHVILREAMSLPEERIPHAKMAAAVRARSQAGTAVREAEKARS